MSGKTINAEWSLAIDLGASNGRLIAGRIANGKLEAREMGRFNTPVLENCGGYACWDVDLIMTRARKAIDACISLGPLRSVGVDSWGVDYVLLDEKLQRVGNAVCYRDKRTNGVMECLQAKLTPEEIYRRTGIQFQPFNTLYQVTAATAQEPEWFKRARHLLMIPDYIHFCLSGVLSNEYTNSTTTQMLNIDGSWDKTLLEAAGLTQDLMLPPIPAATILGPMKDCCDGTVVIAPGTHDTASAVAGIPLQGDDEAYISSGTWSLMGIESKTPIATPEALRMNFTNEGGVERRFRVLKNLTGMWPLQRVSHEFNQVVNDALVEAAKAEPAWRSIIDPDDPAFLAPSSMTEAIKSYCRRTGQPEPETFPQFARCVFDSLSLSYRNGKEQLERLTGRKLSRIRIVGGGCKNRLMNQMCANSTQLPVVAGPQEGSALGNICAQLIALGSIENLDAARDLIRNSFPLEEYVPRDPVPDFAWQRFQQLLQARTVETCNANQ